MNHKMNLQAKYFNYIKSGTKRIELRLFDEKRSMIFEISTPSIFIELGKNPEEMEPFITVEEKPFLSEYFLASSSMALFCAKAPKGTSASNMTMSRFISHNLFRRYRE